MKIAFFHNDYKGTGGLERFLSIWANNFIDNGYEVVFISLYESGEFLFPLNDKVKIISMNETTKAITFRKFLLIYKLYKIIKNEQIDIIIGQMIKPSVILSWLSQYTKVKTIGMEHFAFNSENHPKKWLKRRAKYYKYLSAFVCLTPDDYESYKNLGVKNVQLILNPVQIPESIKYNINSETIISIGRQDPQKNLSALLRSFKPLLTKWPNLKLQIIGKDYGDRKNLIKLSHDLDIYNNIEYIDFTSNISSIYNNASILVLSSIYEGLPVSLIEAKAFGIPCVSYNCPTGPKHIINHQVDGFLVDMHNEKELSNCMEKLIENPLLREKMSIEARKDALNRFNVEKIAPKWYFLFNSLK
jgi:glycosyltransferase involved in cell wall biosynthesis